MPQWHGSDRRERLPSNWSTVRKRVLRRDDNRCTHRNPDTGVRCAEVATDVDHIIAGDNHSMENLTSLCDWHHQRKSSREGAAALLAKRRAHEKKYRRTEKHPGLL